MMLKKNTVQFKEIATELLQFAAVVVDIREELMRTLPNGKLVKKPMQLVSLVESFINDSNLIADSLKHVHSSEK